MSASPVFGAVLFLAGAALTVGACLDCAVVVADVEGTAGVVGVDVTSSLTRSSLYIHALTIFSEASVLPLITHSISRFW